MIVWCLGLLGIVFCLLYRVLKVGRLKCVWLVVFLDLLEFMVMKVLLFGVELI